MSAVYAPTTRGVLIADEFVTRWNRGVPKLAPDAFRMLTIAAPFENLGQIRCRTVIIGGRDDRRTTPAAHRSLAEEIPASELVIVEDAAHFTPLEQPGIVTAVLQSWITD